MKSDVAVLDGNEAQRNKLCRLLQKLNWEATAFNAFQDLENHVGDTDCVTVILNLDNISVDNKQLRKLKMKITRLYIIALSVRPFHPELEESFKEHISVCLNNPVEPDELVYWLKTFES